MAAATQHELTADEQEEIRERRSGEIYFIQSAYSEEEARVVDDPTSDCFSILRRLSLPLSPSTTNESDDEADVKVELCLKMPPTYPIHEDAILVITGSLFSSPSNPPFVRKAALDAIPHLVEACQRTALELAEAQGGGEAVWSVLARADEWIDSEWSTIREKHGNNAIASVKTLNTRHKDTTDDANAAIKLGQRAVYSHHIIANSKRRDLANLASQYNLGGYAKIGWPGVILIEGLESNCQIFVDEIKRWRWQQIQVRGEEQKVIPEGESLDSHRQLPLQFQEIGEDGMSLLASNCREAGLEKLFLTCMKINDHRTAAAAGDDGAISPSDNAGPNHGVLVHVDHMNDAKKYRKWLRKTCQAQGCILLIRQFYFSTDRNGHNQGRRPKIYVGIFGDKDGVKKVMKLWRSSRVDVDSKSKPCLERMMTVVAEGEIQTFPIKLFSSFHDENLGCSFEDLSNLMSAIDGGWGQKLRERHSPSL